MKESRQERRNNYEEHFGKDLSKRIEKRSESVSNKSRRGSGDPEAENQILRVELGTEEKI